MRVLLILSLLFIIVGRTQAQVDIMERKALHDLLEVRKKKFDDYSTSLERKTGFFGNKTKKDLQNSNEVLTDIVKTDNNIISVLNRAIDFKNYEKTNLNYNIIDNSAKLESYRQAADTLGKQVNTLTESNKVYTRELKWLRLVNRILCILLVIAVIMLWRKRVKRI